MVDIIYPNLFAFKKTFYFKININDTKLNVYVTRTV